MEAKVSSTSSATFTVPHGVTYQKRVIVSCKVYIKHLECQVKDGFNILRKELVNTLILRQTSGCQWTACHSAAVQALIVDV